ncbi:MAG TPA: hypothetical protein VMR70_14740 [Flavisolibacter sp.]|nr:hypothetical protein [Flavisolibacter sp.]
MQKLTLKFSSFAQLAAFAKKLNSGYLINTSLLTITASLNEFQTNLAIEWYGAQLIETNERVFSYDPI